MQTLRLFADVARCHSFSEAARLHGITQSAASQRISQLEKRLQTQLIDRSVRPLELTDAGRLFLEGCQSLIERYDELERRVTSLGQGDGPGAGSPGAGVAAVTGTVRVSAIYSAGIELLERVRERFEAEHRQIHVQITYDHPDAVHTAVREMSCDLGIVSYPQRWRGVGVIALRDEPMAVVCAPGHGLAEGDGLVEAGDLDGLEMVAFDAELPVGRRIRRYLRENGARVAVASSFDNLDTIKHVVSVTGAFAILPLRTVAREVEAGTLRARPLSPRLVRPIGIIHRQRHGSGFSPAARLFVDALTRHAAVPEAEAVSGASAVAGAGEAHLAGGQA